jgi:CIC family chloride channel protein
MKDSTAPPRHKYLLRLREAFHQFRYSISYVEALPQLTFLGLIVGVAAGLVIALFRLCIELPLGLLLPAGAESFELLDLTQRWWMLGTGGLVLLLLLLAAGKSHRQVSVGHVLDRLYNYQGHLPATNWYVQFIGGVISVISGQSVGREGPAVHLGAGVASRCAHWLKLPNNSRYTLVGCGVASAISASFNTPLAGVIFAMEVILMEYTLVGFVPVILASFSGAAVAQLVFDGTPLLQIEQHSQMQTLLELPLMLVLSLVIACAGASFIAVHVRTLRLLHWPIAIRLLLATLLTATLAWPVPEIMGLGYDTLDAAVAGKLAAQTLLIVGVAKLISSSAVIALGVPGGIIGPTLVIGACLGGAVGTIAQGLYPTPIAEPGFYVIIGMAGMMAAALNAPMAALVAALELTYNPHMIFPSMLVIVIACLITRNLFHYQGVFIEQLRVTGRDLDFRPALQVLKKTGIANVLNTNLLYTRRQLDYEQAKKILVRHPEWLIFDTHDDQTRDKTALRAADLAAFLESAPLEVLTLAQDIDLLAIPARRLLLSPIHETATLWDALEAMQLSRAEALYVAHLNNPLTTAVRGLVTEDAVKNFYRI